MAHQAKVIYDFEGETVNGELVIKENDILNILRQDVGDGWWEAQNQEGVRGLVPEAYLEIIDNNVTSPDSPDSSVPSPGYDRQDSVTDQNDWDEDDDWDDEPGSPTKQERQEKQDENEQGSPLTKSNSFQGTSGSTDPDLSPLQRSLAKSMHGHATLPNRPMSSVNEEHGWGQDSDEESTSEPKRRVSLEQKPAVIRQQSQVSQSSTARRYQKRTSRLSSDASSETGTIISDSGLNGQGTYGLHGANRGINKRNSEATVKTGTVSKKFASRFSVFAKSGGEAYLLGAANTKKNIPANTEVRIVEIDDGPNWEDPGGQWRFSCEITNPKKESKLKGMKSYIAYQLTPSNTGIRVSRRYKHFDWLYERLAEKFTLICVPQLPEKQVSGRYEESFIEKRMDGLQRWMNRMTAHPIISQCDTFQHFISCTDEKQWKVGKRKAEKDDLVGAAFLQTITPPERTLDVAEVEKQHENFNRFVKSMNESMTVILQSCHESRKRHIGPFKREYVKVGQSFKALADSFEIDTRPKITGSDAPPQESVKLTEAIRNTGATYEDIGQFFASQPNKDLVPLEEFLREYHGMISTFPDMIQFHKHTISTVKECQTRREEQKMEFEEAEAVKTRADVVSYAMMAEINHFQQERVKNFKEGMEAYLMEQIKFYQNITSKLEDALGKFQDI